MLGFRVVINYFFEILKMKIRSSAISYCINKSKHEKIEIKRIEDEINSLEDEFHLNPSDDTKNKLNEKKNEQLKNREKIVDGILLRSKANWHENGEKCSNFFCGLEKRNFLSKTLCEVTDSRGHQLSNSADILNEQKLFYENLYTSKNQQYRDDLHRNTFFDHDVKLTEEMKQFCEGNLTFKECGEALKNMSNGKSPGSDGFTTEFYKFFWVDLGPFLFRSLKYGYEKGEFSEFQYQSVITCIPKEGKDRRYLSNWRPISLMNVDTKIASAVIANRLKVVLPDVISDTQKGFIKGRFIGENTRLLYDLMHYLEENDLEGMLLIIDFEKAFDSVEFDFIINALQSFNFGPSICQWFQTFYKNAKSCVINNGYLSSFFNLQRGCRQGDPLSPYLFIIGVELLSLKLKSNQRVKGIVVNNCESLISQYADDTFLTLDGTEISLRESLKTFENFYYVSGLKMNKSKTSAVWIGSKRYSDRIICAEEQLNWTHSNFKLLGINFSLCMETMIDINFKQKIIDISKLLKSWQHRKLTLLGKITVIKSLALPKIIHLLTSLPNLKVTMLNEINKLFYNFIWDGKTEKIKRNTLIGNFCDGGLKMIHLESFSTYLKMSWIKRLFTDELGIWQKNADNQHQKVGGVRLFNLQKEKLREVGNKITNPFWRDVVKGLHDIKSSNCTNVQDILSLDILNFASLDDFPYFIKWKSKGVTNLKDLIDKHTKTFYTFDRIGQLCNTKNFIKYYSLLSCIPPDLKNQLKEGLQGMTMYDFENFTVYNKFITNLQTCKSIKFVYKDLVKSIFVLPNPKIEAWQEKVNMERFEWRNFFLTLQKCCKNSYLKTFQYKLLHRILPTNTFLFKIGFVNSKVCTFCKNHDETIEHVFYECCHIQAFLHEFFVRLKRVFHDINIDKKNILLGYPEYSSLLNLLVIIVKNYIYKCKLDEKLPNISGVKQKILHYKSLDMYNGTQNNVIHKTQLFWAPCDQIFQ